MHCSELPSGPMESSNKSPRLYLCHVTCPYRSSPMAFCHTPSHRVLPHTPHLLPILSLLSIPLFFFNFFPFYIFTPAFLSPFYVFRFFSFTPSFFLFLLLFLFLFLFFFVFCFFFARPTSLTTGLKVQLRVRRKLQELTTPRSPKIDGVHPDGVVHSPFGRLERFTEVFDATPAPLGGILHDQ